MVVQKNNNQQYGQKGIQISDDSRECLLFFRIRISCDTRWQRADQPVDKRFLHPLPQKLDTVFGLWADNKAHCLIYCITPWKISLRLCFSTNQIAYKLCSYLIRNVSTDLFSPVRLNCTSQVQAASAQYRKTTVQCNKINHVKEEEREVKTIETMRKQWDI